MRRLWLRVLLVAVLGLVIVRSGVAAGVVSGSAKPDPSWSAAHLADNGALAAALGEPVVGIQDDGGFPASSGVTGQISAATVATQSGVVLDLTLYSSRSAADAKSLYQQLSGALSEGVSIADAGDQSRYASGHSVVLKAAQVLDIKEHEGPALRQLLDDTKSNGGDPTAAAAAYALNAQKAAAPLAAAMKGTAATKPVLALPHGAVDPCSLPPKTLAAVLKVQGVTTSYEPGAGAPALTCAYYVPGSGSIEISTLTDAQLKASLSPTTVADKFAADLQSASRGSLGVVTTASTNGAQAFSVISADGALVALEVASKPHGDAVLFSLYQNQSNSKKQCEELFAWIKEIDQKHLALAQPLSPIEIEAWEAKVDQCKKVLHK